MNRRNFLMGTTAVLTASALPALPSEFPAGGVAGQVLMKTDGMLVEWSRMDGLAITIVQDFSKSINVRWSDVVEFAWQD